jgi:hypothetical protein
VTAAGDQLAALLAAVKGVPPGMSLTDKLQQAQRYVAGNQKASACSGLVGFIALVNAQNGKKLTTVQAASFIRQAQSIEATLGC